MQEAKFQATIKGYDAEGFDTMLFVRGDTMDEFAADYNGIKAYLVSEGFAPSKSAPAAPAHAPAPAAAPKAPAPAPAAPAQLTAPQNFVRVEVASIAHAITEKGKDFIRVKGGQFTKFGVSAWPETLPAEIRDTYATWPVGTEYQPPEDMRFAYCVEEDGKVKKVAHFDTA